MKLNLEQIGRAMLVCFAADIPCAIWGGTGMGKSTKGRETSAKLDWRYYDCRLSDKEPSDLGGIPFPVDGPDGTKRCGYLMPDLLPFDCDEKAVIAFDEVDRCPDQVQNVAIQLVLDRSINGHKLSPNARIVMMGNGATDIGTTELNEAFRTRCCHLYAESQSQGALDSYLEWASENDVSPAMQSFARYRNEVWNGTEGEVPELAKANKRTFDMADRLYRIAKAMKIRTDDILPALLAGCVGENAANELVGWYDLHEKAPTLDEIAMNPEKCRLPGELGIFFALGVTIAKHIANNGRDLLPLFATYIARWPEEQAGFAFDECIRSNPKIAACKVYAAWLNSTNP
jgi:MoxR-like ATPase